MQIKKHGCQHTGLKAPADTRMHCIKRTRRTTSPSNALEPLCGRVHACWANSRTANPTPNWGTVRGRCPWHLHHCMPGTEWKGILYHAAVGNASNAVACDGPILKNELMQGKNHVRGFWGFAPHSPAPAQRIVARLQVFIKKYILNVAFLLWIEVILIVMVLCIGPQPHVQKNGLRMRLIACILTVIYALVLLLILLLLVY